MNKRMRLIAISLLLLTLAITPLFAFAGTSGGDGTTNGVTLDFPDNMTNCAPTFHFFTTGVDPTWTVNWYLRLSESGNLTKLDHGSTTGNLDETYTPSPLEIGETRVYDLLVHIFDADGNPVAKLGGQWRVDCEPAGGGEGCTPGFWKNHPDVWPIPLDTDFDTTFSTDDFTIDAFNPDITMDEAVDLRGGQLKALSRHAAAAYLNAVSPVVNYDLSAAEVIAAFQAAFDSGDYNTTKNMFEQLNEQGCPF